MSELTLIIRTLIRVEAESAVAYQVIMPLIDKVAEQIDESTRCSFGDNLYYSFRDNLYDGTFQGIRDLGRDHLMAQLRENFKEK